MLPTGSGPQYFVDVMKYLSTAVKTMCENEKSAFKKKQDWRKEPFFQVRLGPTPPSIQHREAPTSKSGASHSKTTTKTKGPGYTVSYFGEEFHERTIPPTDSLRQTTRYVLGLGVERGLEPHQAACIELIAHGLYCEFSSTEGDFIDLRSMERKLRVSDFCSKTRIDLLGSRLRQLGVTSASPNWAKGDWTEITVQLPPLDSGVFRRDGPSDATEPTEVIYTLESVTGMTQRSSTWPQGTLPSFSLQNPRSAHTW